MISFCYVAMRGLIAGSGMAGRLRRGKSGVWLMGGMIRVAGICFWGGELEGAVEGTGEGASQGFARLV